ncbi:hypothetical protein GGI07_002590 [Coemansia sp. Benny D115]|nr:hypothetical protein GGI07_002590 [Coemansia sp. Benny D115]
MSCRSNNFTRAAFASFASFAVTYGVVNHRVKNAPQSQYILSGAGRNKTRPNIVQLLQDNNAASNDKNYAQKPSPMHTAAVQHPQTLSAQPWFLSKTPSSVGSTANSNLSDTEETAQKLKVPALTITQAIIFDRLATTINRQSQHTRCLQVVAAQKDTEIARLRAQLADSQRQTFLYRQQIDLKDKMIFNLWAERLANKYDMDVLSSNTKHQSNSLAEANTRYRLQSLKVQGCEEQIEILQQDLAHQTTLAQQAKAREEQVQAEVVYPRIYCMPPVQTNELLQNELDNTRIICAQQAQVLADQHAQLEESNKSINEMTKRIEYLEATIGNMAEHNKNLAIAHMDLSSKLHFEEQEHRVQVFENGKLINVLQQMLQERVGLDGRIEQLSRAVKEKDMLMRYAQAQNRQLGIKYGRLMLAAKTWARNQGLANDDDIFEDNENLHMENELADFQRNHSLSGFSNNLDGFQHQVEPAANAPMAIRSAFSAVF